MSPNCACGAGGLSVAWALSGGGSKAAIAWTNCSTCFARRTSPLAVSKACTGAAGPLYQPSIVSRSGGSDGAFPPSTVPAGLRTSTCRSAPLQQVVPGPAREFIMARPACEPIRALSALQTIVAGTAVQQIIALAPHQHIVPVLPVERIVSRAPVHRVVPGAPDEQVIPLVPVQHIVPVPATKCIVRRTSV